MTFIEFSMLDNAEKRAAKEKKAASAKCTPLHVSAETESGTFRGSSGEYTTTLSACSCGDFIRYRLPCKHMYRLAHELGVYDLGAVKSDASKIPELRTKSIMDAAFEHCTALIESYPEELQKEIQMIMYYHKIKHGDALDKWYVCSSCSELAKFQKPISDGILSVVNEPIAIIKTKSKKQMTESLTLAGFQFPKEVGTTQKAKYQWCLDNPEIAVTVAFPDTKIVTVSGDLEVAFTKTYTYLNKKFDTVSSVLYPEFH